MLKQERRNLSPNKASEKKQCNTRNSLEPSYVDFSLKREVFPWRNEVVHFWGRSSGNQDDHQRQKAYTEWDMSPGHRVALDWLFDRINLDSKIQIRYVNSRNQIADILTKGNYTTWWMEPPSVFVWCQPFQLSKLRWVQFSKLFWSYGEATTRRWLLWKSRRQIEASQKFGIEELCGAINDAIFDGIFKPGAIRIKMSRNEVWN